MKNVSSILSFILASIILWMVMEARADTYVVTGYCPCKLCCGPKAHGVTASGRSAKGKLAACNCLPFGTWVTVPGYGRCQVLDRGGKEALAGKRIDLLFPTHRAAKLWGRKALNVGVGL